MSNPMAKIAQVAEERRQNLIRPAHRLIDASKLVRRYHHELPLPQDLFEEQNAINAWATVTTCYSGIEQAMKFLLKIDESLRLTGDDRHHRIGDLFQRLPEEQREVVRESYSVYQSLHDYIGGEKADGFLGEISDGYKTWRYFLSEGGALPTTHCGAMLEIWSALANIIEARVFKNCGLYHCAHRFDKYLSGCVHEARLRYIDPEIGETTEITEDLNRWVGVRGQLLNSWANMLQHHAMGADGLDVLPRTKKILRASIDMAKNLARSDQDFACFLRRAEDQGIMWNHSEKRFEGRRSQS